MKDGIFQAFKVVTKSRNRLFSARAAEHFRSAILQSIEYKVGKWTAPDNQSCLFVFDSLKSAKTFAYASESIFTCKIDGRHIPKSIPSSIECVDDYWRAFFSKKRLSDFCDLPYITPILSLPYGTILTRRVKLLEQVK